MHRTRPSKDLIPLYLEIERTLSGIRRARRVINLELESASESEEEMADNRTVLDLIRPPVEVRLRLFSFSLQGDALEWLDDLPVGSITTWTDLFQTFLNKYFPPTKMAKLFSNIISFKQKGGESLHVAWTRFKKILRMCSQHNLTQSQQTQTFYNGSDQSVRSMLDAAANRSLFRKTPADAWEIIDNMEESDVGWLDVKKEKKDGVLEVDALTDLNAKIDSLTHQMTLMQTTPANQVQVNLPEEQKVFEVDAANFAGNQGRPLYNLYSNTYNPGWKNHPNFLWKPADPTANTSKSVEKKSSFEEIMMKYVVGTRTRLQNQEAMLQKLETQMIQIATQLSARQTGSLPSNTEKNSRDINSIMAVTRLQANGKKILLMVRKQ
ncbi:uncharacterized protein [Henckelia pumila]|uniref:uncharacterized protein n=1 Tax=Henckelia pumila TaxID=405737 RepID=UPI003C6DD67A